MVGNESNAIVALGTLAASGTGNVVIQVPDGANKLFVTTSVHYAAVTTAATGLQTAFQFSDDGASYSNSAKPNTVAAGVAGQVTQAVQEIGLADLVTRADAGTIEDYKVLLTNLDGSNACQFAVQAKFE